MLTIYQHESSLPEQGEACAKFRSTAVYVHDLQPRHRHTQDQLMDTAALHPGIDVASVPVEPSRLNNAAHGSQRVKCVTSAGRSK